MALKSKLSRLLVVGELCRLDAALDHPAFALDQLQFAQSEQVLDMVLALGRTLPRQLGVLALEGWQLELLEVVLQQHLRAYRSCRAVP